MMCDESFKRSARKVEFNLLCSVSLKGMGRKFCANCSACVLAEMMFINSTYACVLTFAMIKRQLCLPGEKKSPVLGHVS